MIIQFEPNRILLSSPSQWWLGYKQEDEVEFHWRCVTYDKLKLFFIDKEKNLAMLDKYPRVKNLFLEFNTALPSSASVERLFSAGPLVLTARRNRLADAIFETLLMLKVNLNP